MVNVLDNGRAMLGQCEVDCIQFNFIFRLLNNIQRRLRVLLYKSWGDVLDQGRARLDQSRVRLDQEEARVDWSGANVLGQSEA